MKTHQEVFDIVARHLLAQNRKSTTNTDVLGLPMCRYRLQLEDNTVLKCAIGVLIPDGLYHSGLEGFTVGKFKTSLLKQMGLEKITAGLLRSLQSVHDVNEPEYWRDKLFEVAKEYRLNTTVLEQ